MGARLVLMQAQLQINCRNRGLVSLQKLCCIDADPDNGMLGDIGSLSQLTKLNVGNLRKEDRRALCSSIQSVNKLRRLSLRSVTG